MDIVRAAWQNQIMGNPMYCFTTKLRGQPYVLLHNQASWATLCIASQPSFMGNPMYSFTTKLRILKIALRSLHRHNTSHISRRVAEAQSNWNQAQMALDESPALEVLAASERNCARLYNQLCKDEEAIYKQRSRIQCLQLGDRNTKFFHRSLVHRQTSNAVHVLTDEAGNQVYEKDKLGTMAVKYFQQLLTAPPPTPEDNIPRLYPTAIPSICIPNLIQAITEEEIKMALFSIPDNKAPGLDGFTAYFFKQGWEIIRIDFIAAIQFFFDRGSLPRCINATRIALVPKVENPTCMNDYRPISCCNVMYKCISKILATRLKTILPEVIGPSQAAFVPGRQISDNILLTQELMHKYHMGRGPARCALKVDLKKAFDTISWDFILKALQAIGIPGKMVGWIHTCISSTYFSISLNEELHGFFQSSRGLRQGDPLPPYLFVLAMEGLGGALNLAATNPLFRFHWRCKQNSIIHLSFADDLMLFCKANLESMKIIQDALDSFSCISGLTINHDKSLVFLSGVKDDLRTAIVNCLGFKQGTLLVNYLGVPMISSRLTHQNCLQLLERILSRIKLWTSTSLTYAGRLQLIKSTLFSMQVYWSSMFILPTSIIRNIESSLAAFLWKGTSLTHTGAKVAWATVCYPLEEGGLGIKNIKTWNKAATLKHVWRLLTEETSTWAAWVKSVLLRGRCFWYMNIPSSSSWSWRKILQSRSWCKGLFVPLIGNGMTTFLWLDYWLLNGRRLCDILPFRMLSTPELPWNAKVSDIITNGRLAPPPCHQDLQQIWNSINIHPQILHTDTCIWQGNSSGRFTIDSAWDLLRDARPRGTKYHLIWFPGHTPRHAFILWIASMDRLYTIDRLLCHRIINVSTCILCGQHAETHDHLFFQCTYSSEVWGYLSAKTLFSWPSTTWQSLLKWAASTFRKKDFTHILSRLVLSTAVYYLWYERNNRIFKQIYRISQELSDEAFEIIRACLMNKDHTQIPMIFKSIWNLTN